MNNFSKITLEPMRAKLVEVRISVRRSLERLSNKTGDFAEHHQHLINTYSEMIHSIDVAIFESESIGKGV